MVNLWLGKLKGHISEAKNRAKADKLEREAAEKHPNSIILTKREVQGEWDASRVLVTTIGGAPRPITTNDLAQFRHNMRMAQKNFNGDGITARQVIDLASSKPMPGTGSDTDIDRARKQITMAVPVSAFNNEVRFITNAGPDSEVNRHHVLVRFNAFSVAANKLMASTAKERRDPKQTANWLRKQKLAFDCSCGRHRYWFRYISTIGNFNAGRKEMGFPKIRNPNLKGVACKHVLRVMSEVESSTSVLNFLAKHMEKLRDSQDNTAKHRIKQKEHDDEIKKRANSRVNTIKTSEQRAAERKRAKERESLHKKAKQVKRIERKPTATRRIEAALASGKLSASDLEVLRRIGFTDKQVAEKLKG
ncbi:MAG: hypothetical protein IPP22_08670 [Nitrosomonas sp.]|nr:hypothetical protein [Nitrosomonas sp.]